MKVITVIVATYNPGSSIVHCLNSITTQLSDKVELVIVDGGSTDATKEIIEMYGSSVSLFISEKDNGIYDAWNKGIRASSGEWIMFIGADDILLQGALSHYLEFIENNDVSEFDFICAEDEYVDGSGNLLNVYGKEPSWDNLKYSISVAHVAALHSRERLFGQVGLFDTSFPICADYEMLLRKGRNLKYAYLKHRIARMTCGGASCSMKALMEAFSVRKKHHTIPLFVNLVLTAKDMLVYLTYWLRHRSI